MKKIFSTIALGVGVLALASCSGNKQQAVSTGDAQTVSVAQEATTVPVALAESTLKWKGFKPGGEHFGAIGLSAGEIKLEGQKLLAGYVEVQMNSIVVEDLEGEMAEKLKAHLESEDFFEVAKYPTARFELTDLPQEGVELTKVAELKGNLTLKDVTKNITIPVEEVVVDPATGAYHIKSKTFTINRADWNVRYGSKSFFNNLKDKFIEDNMELQFVLVAKA